MHAGRCDNTADNRKEGEEKLKYKSSCVEIQRM